MRYGIKNLREKNVDWQLEISDDVDVERYLLTHLSRTDYWKICNKKTVEKVDLWRFLKMFHEGGVYTDIDI
ncbi:MAG: glycosyltransferase [Nonlabens sp.]